MPSGNFQINGRFIYNELYAVVPPELNRLWERIMEDLWSKQPFFNRHEFIGNLSRCDEVADKLHIVVQYSLIKEGEIVGKVLGTTKTCEKLRRFTNFSGPYPYLKLTSDEISSDRVLLGTTIDRPGYNKEMSYIVANLSFEDITITRHFGPSDSHERHLTFFLAGPRRLWSIHETPEFSFTGDIKNKVHNSKIELNEDFPFEIEVIPCYFRDKTSAPDNHYELTANVLTMHFKTKESLEQLSNDDLVNSGKALADDITLLMSFLSRRWITWYRYELATNDSVKAFTRRTRDCATQEPNWSDTLIEPDKSRKFLKIGLSNLRKLRAENFDLFMPLLYFVSGHEAKYLEEQFTTSFLSLEKIKDMFAIKKNFQKNLKDRSFKKLRSLISETIRRNTEFSEVVEKIQGKIPELNRPSLRFILESLFKEYNITWKDIYPSTSKFTLIKTRDDLFHSSQKFNIGLLVKELYRLQALIERLLLRMLGWQDLSRSPAEHKKKWLTTVENDSNHT